MLALIHVFVSQLIYENNLSQNNRNHGVSIIITIQNSCYTNYHLWSHFRPLDTIRSESTLVHDLANVQCGNLQEGLQKIATTVR
jgi:hypothetical protein